VLADIYGFRRAALGAPDAEIQDLVTEIIGALEGDSNDADHDALVSVAQFFGIEYNPEEA
jgi:hypothetical protein